MPVDVTAARRRSRAHLGRCLESARSHARLSQDAAAAALGVSRKTIGNWEAGKREPLLTDALALADLYGVKLAELAGRERLSVPPAPS